jgi:hypothetical protein
MHAIREHFMRKTSHILGIIFALFLLSMATEKSLIAYADPGSGAMFVQIILAGFIGSLFRIRSFVKRFRMPKDKGKDESLRFDLGRDHYVRPSK